MIWEIERLSFDHSDQRRSLVDWFSGDIRGEGIQRVTFFETKKGNVIGNHYHERQSEAYFIIRGKGVVVLKDIDTHENLVRLVGPRSRIIIPPRIAHALYFKTDMLLEIASTKKFDPQNPDMTAYDLSHLLKGVA